MMRCRESKQSEYVWRSFWLLVLLFYTCFTIQAQRLPIRTFTSADGLAHNLIFQIVRDSRGYLWFCTDEGLSRFDGYVFTNYTTDQGLPSRRVNDLVQTRSGVYWVATQDALSRFNPQSATHGSKSSEPMFVAYRLREKRTALITKLYEDHMSVLWVGTTGGLYQLEETDGQVKFRFVDIGMPTTGNDPVVENILEDRRGALWVGTRSGLYRRLPDGSAQRYDTRHGLPDNDILALLEDREGRLWVGTASGVSLIVPEPKPNQPVVARVYARGAAVLFQSSDGRMWAGGASGLSEFTIGADEGEPNFRSYARAQGLNYEDVMSLAEDSAGNLWIGATGGAMKLARNGFITYTDVGARTPLNVLSIFETRSGELCFVAFIPGGDLFLIRYDEKSLSAIQPNFPKHIFGNTHSPRGWNQYGLQDLAGEWWIPTRQGLFRFPRVSAEQLAHVRPKAVYTTKHGLIGDDVGRIYEDSRGDIWISSSSRTAFGLTRWERASEVFHHYNKTDGLPSGTRTSAFCEDASGNIWIGMGTTLARYTAGRFTLFTTKDGLPRSGIGALHLDPAGRLWIATDSAGLSRIDDPKTERPNFVTYTTANGLSSNQVAAITSDQWGRVYAFTGRGLDRLDPATARVKHYTASDGLVGDMPTAAFRDRNGALWFATAAGFSKLVPELDSPEYTPPILISGLRIVGQRHPLSELGETEVPQIRLGPNDNQIQIDFVGLSFGTGEQLMYQYKLEGADADWSPPSEQRSINYARLSPGSYRFLVRAVTSEGATSQTPASVSFIILPPIWQRWWFLSSSAIVICLVAYSLYRYRVARLIELERIRTRIATDLHDDIGADLSLIAMASEVARRHERGDNRQMTEALSLISGTSRELVDSMGDIVWAVNPHRDHLVDLVKRMRRFASDAFSARNIAFRFEAPSEDLKIRLGTETRREVLLIFKEGVNNIARHSGCTQAEIELRVQGGLLKLKLSDNGKGFDVAQSFDGNGLLSIRQRAERLGGKLEVVSGDGEGTTLTLKTRLK